MESITISYQYKGPQYIGLSGNTKQAEIVFPFSLGNGTRASYMLSMFVPLGYIDTLMLAFAVIIVNLLVFVVLRVCAVFCFVLF